VPPLLELNEKHPLLNSYIVLNSTRQPNGLRYPLVGGTRQRRSDGTSFEPKKLLENAHAVPTGSTLRSHHDSPSALPGVGCITLALAGSARVIPVIVRDAVLACLYA